MRGKEKKVKIIQREHLLEKKKKNVRNIKEQGKREREKRIEERAFIFCCQTLLSAAKCQASQMKAVIFRLFLAPRFSTERKREQK